MPPLKTYTVHHPKQEIIDRAAEAFRIDGMASLKLVDQNGEERDVTFTVEQTDRNKLNVLVIGTTVDKESINISIPANDSPTALLRT